MSLQLDVRPEQEVATTTERIVVYGDFNCPWSYLASRRARVLAHDGVAVDWRAVEHAPGQPSRFTDRSVRSADLREEMDHVLALLLPGEELPYSLAGFVPPTRAAVSAYAEGYAAGVAGSVRDLLFEAFWVHGFDLGDAKVVRTLLVDAIRSGSSPSELLRDWGYAVDVTGGPITTTAWRLVSEWADQWNATGKETVPVVLDGDATPWFGTDAVEWLGAELVARGLDPAPAPTPELARGRSTGDTASHSWVSQHGNRWMRDYQQAHRPQAFPGVN